MGTNHEDPAPRMLPALTAINRPFWTGGRTGQLLILRSRATGRYVHPPELVDVDDPAQLTAEPVSGKGTVLAYTVNSHVYNPAVPVPYVVALVQLDEQSDLRVPTNIVNCDPAQVHIGMRVQVCFEDRGDVFVPLFEPDREGSND